MEDLKQLDKSCETKYLILIMSYWFNNGVKVVWAPVYTRSSAGILEPWKLYSVMTGNLSAQKLKHHERVDDLWVWSYGKEAAWMPAD